MNDSAGKVLAGRYRVISSLSSSGGVITAWRATDLAFGDEVAVYSLSQEPRWREGASREFLAVFASACRVPRAGMISWHAVNIESGLAVREWVHGFTLQDLLRRRRKISISEALSLLGDVAKDLDRIMECGITPQGDLLQETWIAFVLGGISSGR